MGALCLPLFCNFLASKLAPPPVLWSHRRAWIRGLLQSNCPGICIIIIIGIMLLVFLSNSCLFVLQISFYRWMTQTFHLKTCCNIYWHCLFIFCSRDQLSCGGDTIEVLTRQYSHYSPLGVLARKATFYRQNSSHAPDCFVYCFVYTSHAPLCLLWKIRGGGGGWGGSWLLISLDFKWFDIPWWLLVGLETSVFV